MTETHVTETQVTETHVHAPLSTETEPSGELCIRTLAMPADTNANGDIFGGWLLGQMDLGGGVFASKIAKSRTVTVAIEAMNFRKAVYVGDLVSVYGNLVRVGRTSITVHLEDLVRSAEIDIQRGDSAKSTQIPGVVTPPASDAPNAPPATKKAPAKTKAP